MAIYAIGDIHGCYKALKKLLSTIPSKPKDQFIFLGDYVDKGPDTKKVIDLLLDFSKQYTTTFVQGNHELLMLAAQQNEKSRSGWLKFGGEQTLQSYKAKNKTSWYQKIAKEHWVFLKQLKSYAEHDQFIFVHAGVEVGVPLSQQNEHHLFWKKLHEPNPYGEGRIVICGHTAQKSGEIAHFGHTICIDTYAHGGGWLTALEVSSGQFYQANQKGDVQKGKIEM